MMQEEQTWDLTHSDSDSELNNMCNIGEEFPEPVYDEEQVFREQEDDGLDLQPPDAELSSRPATDRNQFRLPYWPQQLWREDNSATLHHAPRQETRASRDRDPWDRPCHHHHSCCSESGFEVMVPRAPAEVLQRTEECVHHQPAFLTRPEENTATYGYGVPPTTGDWLQQPSYPSRQEEYAATNRRGVLPTTGDWLQQPSCPSRQEEYAAMNRRGLVDFLHGAHEETPRSPEIDLTPAEYPCNDSPWMLSAGQLECAVRRHQYALTLLRKIQAQRERLSSRSHQCPLMPFVAHPDRVLSGSHLTGSDRPPAPDLGFGRGRGRGRMPHVLREFGVGRGRRRLHHPDRDFGI